MIENAARTARRPWGPAAAYCGVSRARAVPRYFGRDPRLWWRGHQVSRRAWALAHRPARVSRRPRDAARI